MFNFLKSRRKKNYEQVALSNLCEFLNIGSYDKSRMAEVTYFTCLKVLSEAVSKLPIALQKVMDDNGIIDMTSDTLWTTIRTRPNPFMTPCTFWSATENCRNHYGNAYVYIDRSTSGVNLWILDPKCVRIKMSMLCDLSEQPDIYYVYTSPQTGEEHVYRSDEILHFKTSTTFGGLIGLSVQEKLKLSLDGAVKSQEMLNSLYENNFVPKVAVQFQPGAETNTQLKEQYIQQLQNYADGKVKGTRSFLPVAFGTSLVPLNIKLTDGQFLELRKYTALQIASAFGIKPNHLNDYEKSSYTNSETQQLAFYTDTMLYIIKQYEEELNFKLLSDEQRKSGYRFKFNIAAVLRGDTKSQLESLAQGVSNGVYTPNEARRNLDLPSKPGGDRLYFNGSNIPIDQAGEQYKEKSLETLAKSLESAIIDLHKYSDSQPRDDHGRWTDGGGDSSSGGGSSVSSRNSDFDEKEITDDTIAKVPFVKIFDDETKDKAYQKANEELLTEAKKYPVGTEVSIVYDKDMKPIENHGYVVGKIGGGEVHIDNPDVPYHAFHNHPTGNTLSPDDVLNMTKKDNMLSITAVGNNAEVFCMQRSKEAKAIEYQIFLADKFEEGYFIGGKFSYSSVKDFNMKELPDELRIPLQNEMVSFCKECIEGGKQFGFNYTHSGTN